ncbi:MAG TPA: NAD(P)H-hydrate dehydratase [Bacteroidales bacterium]|nr:NAD(P)H-hydrate dehydratase [Bacteroidales bacterium]
MKIFRTSQIKSTDAYTIQNEPIPSVDLMERAAKAVTHWLVQRFSSDRTVRLFAGPGNNGGDAWAVARLLSEQGFGNIQIYLLNLSDRISEDSELNRERLIRQHKVEICEIGDERSFPVIENSDLLIDGLFGSGLTRPLEGLAARLVRRINQSDADVVSIDIPSGLFGEDNAGNIRENIIKATNTLTFQFPKLSFFYAENEECVGDWHILPIGLHPDMIDKTPSDFHYVTLREVQKIIRKRSRFSHKGTCGNALLIAGSYGMMGAAVIAAKACLRGGAGLVTAHVPRSGVNIIQTAVPESLISIDQSDDMFTGFPDLSKFSAIAVGPAIDCKADSRKALKDLLEASDKPMVIDADALNILGRNKEWLKSIPKNSILTPHPKEFERIAGESRSSYERNLRQIELAQELGVYIVLKGAYSSIATPEGNCFFNSTGNPGMATAGSGDALTGIILSLLAQGYAPEQAAIAGVFLHGLAADLASLDKGEYSLISSDIVDYLGKAFLKIQESK